MTIKLKQDRFDDKRTAGYQSKILDNITATSELESALSQSNRESLSTDCQYGQPLSTYIYGAVSKGIIKRDQQNNSSAYKVLQSSANPFQQMDKEDVDNLKKTFAQKQLREQGKLIMNF